MVPEPSCWSGCIDSRGKMLHAGYSMLGLFFESSYSERSVDSLDLIRFMSCARRDYLLASDSIRFSLRFEWPRIEAGLLLDENLLLHVVRGSRCPSGRE